MSKSPRPGSKRAQLESEKAEAIAKLREILSPGDTVFTVLRKVSASGMRREIDLYVFRDNRPVYLSGYAATALGRKRSKGAHWAVICHGCGMDMGFDLVYSLGRVLFPEYVRSETDSYGGYALHHSWL